MLRKIGERMRLATAKVVAAAPAVIRDSLGLAAIGSIAFGAWEVYPPAGFIVAGVLVLAGVLASR